MDKSLTVKEIHLKYWRPFTIMLGIATVLLFIIFWNLTDPLWASVFRVASFLCFAGTVFGALKLIEGNLTIELQIADRELIIRYFKDGRLVRKEQYELSSINNILPSSPGSNWTIPILWDKFEGFIIEFKDSDRILYLFEFGGRPLVFSSEKVDQITAFLSSHQLIQNTKDNPL